MRGLLASLRRVPSSVWLLLALVIGILLPLRADNYVRAVLWQTLVYALLGLSLNIIVGYAGLFQLGHAAFFAIGAYTLGILNIYLGVPIFLGMIAAVIVAGIFGFVITRPILHLRGDYLCIVTIAFGEIVRMLLVNNIGGITGASNGLSGIAQPAILGYTFRSTLSHYYLVLGFVAITIIAMRRLENSRLGRAWTYVREDEMAAEAMGVDTVRVKATAFLLGSAWAGLAGALYASRISVISPELSTFTQSVIMFCVVVLGGTGSIPGVFVGAAGMIILPELFRFVKDWRDGFVGLAMVLMMIFRPKGLWPSQRFAMETGEEEEKPVAAPAAAS